MYLVGHMGIKTPEAQTVKMGSIWYSTNYTNTASPLFGDCIWKWRLCWRFCRMAYYIDMSYAPNVFGVNVTTSTCAMWLVDNYNPYNGIENTPLNVLPVFIGVPNIAVTNESYNSNVSLLESTLESNGEGTKFYN
jgi:hypothetical protein